LGSVELSDRVDGPTDVDFVVDLKLKLSVQITKHAVFLVFSRVYLVVDMGFRHTYRIFLGEAVNVMCTNLKNDIES
jgi:hypothetical protein